MLQTKLGKHTVNAVRMAEVLQVFAKHGFADLLQRAGFHNGLPARVLRGLNLMEAPKGSPSTIGERLRDALTELGPTFIKLGQVLSTRPDVIGPKLADELSALQDRVEPMPFSQIKPILEEELHGPLESHYASFNETPVASASLSQVYRAQLHTGEEVAVKVCRPDGERRIESDLSLMAQMADWISEQLDEARIVDPVAVVEEFSRSIRRELDFGIEARVIDQFRKNFRDIDFVLVPEVYHTLSGKGVLTMEWIDGVRVDDFDAYEARDSDRETVALNGCEALCMMVFEHHLFHADPHPGNLFLTYDNQLAFLDLGMAGHLERTDVSAIADLFLAIFHEDAEECVEAILALSHQGADVVDREGLEHEVADFVAFEAEMIIRDGNVSKGLDRAVQILNRHHLRLAPRFSLLLKGLATIEVVGRKLYPDLDFIPILEPYVRNLIAERYQPSHLMRDAQQNAATLLKLSRQLPIDLSMSLQQLRKGQLSVRLKHDQIHTLANTMDRTSNRNALATVIASMIIGSSLIVTAETALRPLGYFGFVAAAMLGVWLVISIITSRKY